MKYLIDLRNKKFPFDQLNHIKHKKKTDLRE